MLSKSLLAGFSGGVAGFIGSPADLVNVRLQDDVKLPIELRRNYKHVFDGLYQIWRKEGFVALYAGVSLNSFRGLVITIGQIAVYEQAKQMLIQTSYFDDTTGTFLFASVLAGFAATTLTQPIDVIKTRRMNASEVEIKNIRDVISATAGEGPLAFFKGFIPALSRIAPHTILTFLILEKMSCYFGYESE